MLLFVNLAFMAWAGWVDTPRQAKAPDATARLPRLKLVSEASTPPQSNRTGGTGAGAVQKMAMTTPASAPPAAPPGITRCVSVGPFNDIDVAAKAAGSLKARGFVSQQRAASGETSDGYWVYISGAADAGAADKILETLDRNGIRDAHLTPDAGDAHRISVGLFSERDRAERRAKAVGRLGLKAEVGQHAQPGTVYWVDLALKPSDQALPVEDLLSADSGNSHLSIEACPTSPGGAPEATPAVTPAATPQAAPAGPAPAASPVPATTVAGAPKLP